MPSLSVPPPGARDGSPPPESAATLETLAAWANCLSPIVQPDPPDSLLLDVTGCERLFHGEANLLRLAIEGLASQGLPARGAVADTVGAAWAVAHEGRSPAVVPPGQTAAAVAPLSPGALRLPEREVSTLIAVGVRKVETLLQIPRASLAARFGDALLHRLDQVIGGVPEWIEAYRPPDEPVSRIRFAGATDRIEVIHEAIDRLLAFFCEQLVRRVLGVRQLLCTLYHEDAAPTTLEIGLTRATQSARHLRALLTAKLEGAPLAAPVFGLMLWTRATERLRDTQGMLFDTDGGDDACAGETADELACLLDRLSNRLGAGAVVRPELVEDHQPEWAYRYVSVADRAKTAKRSDGATERRNLPRESGESGEAMKGMQLRPLRLFLPPVLVPAMAVVPDGPPTWFRWEGREHVVAEAAGPERIETGWWRGCDVRRDYFAVTSREGRRFWLFRDRPSGRWFVHGCFA